MTTNDVRRQQLIQTAIANGTGEAAVVGVQLWQSLAHQLVSIIGERGFYSLYARSLNLTRKTVAWLVPCDTCGSAADQFIELKTSFTGRTASEVYQVSSLLLLTFFNLLASLIGEPLTISIVCSAWSIDASTMQTAVKEFPNE